MKLEKLKEKILDSIWRVLMHILSDKFYLELRYFVVFKSRLNLRTPVTFSEKLQWLKLYGCRPEYTDMADKVEMKNYVSSKLGNEYVIPTLGVWNSPEEIDFGSLPESFVLKCNHDSGNVIICHDKKTMNFEAVRKQLADMLRHDYYLQGRETPYKKIRRRILAEPLLQADGREDLVDYKVHNFNGEPKVILVCANRFSTAGLTEDFFSREWKHLDLKRPLHPNAETEEPRPQQIDEILRISRKLSEGIPFLRTDFYIIGNNIYIGELTFFPSSGLVPFVPGKWDRVFGDWLKLPEKNA